MPTLALCFGKRTIEAETLLSFVGVGALDDPFALSGTYSFVGVGALDDPFALSDTYAFLRNFHPLFIAGGERQSPLWAIRKNNLPITQIATFS